MTTNNYNHQPCDQAEALVSYLYGEISAVESARFDSHLVNCRSCLSELAAFDVVRSQVAEWRQEEFAPIAVPAIELPTKGPVILTDQPGVAGSLLDSIRAFFTPQVAIGAAGFAAIIVFAGLMFAVWNSQSGSNDNILAANETPKQQIAPAASPTIEKSHEVAKENNAPTQAENSQVEKAHDIAVTPRNERRVNRSTNERSNRVAPTRSEKLDKDLREAKNQKLEDLDDIYHDELETDDSLRLADLFGESDTE